MTGGVQPAITDQDAQAFWSRVAGRSLPDDCWRWSTTGRVKLAEPGCTLSPRRMAWILLEAELALEPLDEDHVLRLLCVQKRCVNLRHMHRVHKPVRDPDVTSCARGHEMTDENGYRAADGTWVCRPCKREHMRRYRDDPVFRVAQAAAARCYMERHPERSRDDAGSIRGCCRGIEHGWTCRKTSGCRRYPRRTWSGPVARSTARRSIGSSSPVWTLSSTTSAGRMWRRSRGTTVLSTGCGGAVGSPPLRAGRGRASCRSLGSRRCRRGRHDDRR